LQNPSRFDKNKNHQQRIIDTQKLFNYFNDCKEIKGKEYVFYISAITISELSVAIDTDLLDILLILLNSGDITFVDFTKEIAFNLSRNIREQAPDYSINQILSHLEKELKGDNQITNTRNWIDNDFKIVSTAKSLRRLDVVLTADRRTFTPICQKLDIPYIETSDLPKDMFNEIKTN
tara:strand:- start:1616 stop:2146 length:531 start_codon:yes stop_codon:yes gene_type:complete